MYKVLIAEDEERILRGIKNLIAWEEHGLTVVHMALNGEEALSMWEEEPVDIIITDISMPGISGLDFLARVREKDKRVRCMILTGYDEFDYAKTAIPLDVEDYILKPISEEGLLDALKKAKRKLEEMDYKYRLFDFLKEKITSQEFYAHEENYELPAAYPAFRAALMIWKKEEVQGGDLHSYLNKTYREEEARFYYEGTDEIFIIKRAEVEEDFMTWFMDMQNQLEGNLEAGTFLTISRMEREFYELPRIYRRLHKLQKYLLIEGYGFCLHEDEVNERESKNIEADEEYIRKLLISRDRVGFKKYLDDLLMSWMQGGGRNVEDLYKLFVKISLILQKIIDEFGLEKTKEAHDMLDIIEAIYQMKDLSQMKGIFAAVAAAITEEIKMEKWSYSPIIRKVLKEVEEDGRNEKNLKVLAAKYNVNASYLGQLFQKEVGCSFTTHVNNLRNARARDLILNTDRKINDIAKELGYEETSYFYRKFKQCYGVSPASLREMKKI